ncbi:hypothetical protein CE91St36_05390 [Christensenellaceae bacterium]|nr:hypothetical protein CE91St36_05390 [Christensenellaceae bacterium]BDF60390.1 hypothetical protein CE91St37_05400 [Christensenellaceae bacterium]
MTEKTEEKYEKLWCMLACLGAAVALMAAGVLAGWIVLILVALFVPMAFIIAGARGGQGIGILSVLIGGALVFLFAGVNIALIMMACCLPIVIVMTYVIRRRMPLYYSTLISCVALLASLGILILLTQLLYHADLMTLLLNNIEAFLNANPDFAKLYYTLYHSLMNGTASVDITAVMSTPLDVAVSGLMKTFTVQLATLVPQTAMFCVALFGLLNYVIPRAIVKRQGVAVGKVPTFSQLALPAKYGTWSLVALVVAFIGMSAGWRNFNLVYAIVMGFFSITYTIQGMAFTDWLLKRKLSSASGRIAIIIVIFLILQLFNLDLFMWVGFFEQIVKFRKRQWMPQG